MTMQIITERTLILEASRRWDRQYPPETCRTDKSDKRDALRGLDLSVATADDLEKIIGNRLWSRTPSCSECRKENVDVVIVGEEPDYESNTAYLCKECAEKAYKIFG